MPNCYTCAEEIVFDKTIISKTGKQIPLWPDKKNTHGHDEQGQPIRGQLPTQNLSTQQTQQFNQYNREQPAPPPSQARLHVVAQKTSEIGSGPSSGGSYMDTKRLRVMVEDLTKQVNGLEMKLESHVIIDSNRYENQMQIIYHKLGPLMDSTLTAAEMYKQQQPQRDPLSINHGRIADQNELKEGKIREDRKELFDKIEKQEDFPIEETLKDDEDDEDEDGDNKGVVEDL